VKVSTHIGLHRAMLMREKEITFSEKAWRNDIFGMPPIN
jgi:hypothetical protein